MYQNLRVAAVIPALNEEAAIGVVVSGLLALGKKQAWVDHVVVCDNGSTDRTAFNAERAGAIVVEESQPGYGKACLTAIASLPPCDIVLFVDGDDSCYLSQAQALLDGICTGADLSIGSRSLGQQESGALTVPQQFGNWLAAKLINFLWHQRVTDLGPFRAIRHDALQSLNMRDEAFGWTVEMQVKAIQQRLIVREFAVDSKVRIGESKISGTVKGVVGAAFGIFGTIFRLWLRGKLSRSSIKNIPT